MPRPKPFSGKQKKEQLQQKRQQNERKRESSSGSDDDGSGGHTKAGKKRGKHAEDCEEEIVVGADKGGIRSHFAREKQSDVDARRQASYAPITNRDFTPSLSMKQWLLGKLPVPQCISLCPRVLDFSKFSGDFDKVRWQEHEQRIYAQWLRSIDAAYGHAADPGMQVNLFERNIDVWRQFWYTIDKSDVVVIVCDARYPIFHLPLSVLEYVVTLCHKKIVVLLNKVDLLPRAMVDSWKELLASLRVRVWRYPCAGDILQAPGGHGHVGAD